MENPYSPPQAAIIKRLPPCLHRREIGFILLFSVCVGILIGVLTSSLSRVISKEYFNVPQQTYYVTLPWLTIILHGAGYGLLGGFLNGVLYLLVLAIASKRCCMIHQANKFIVWAAVIAMVVWLIFGGIGQIGIGFQPRYPGDLLAFRVDARPNSLTWVRNGVNGLIYFSPVITLIAAACCILKYRQEWKHEVEADLESLRVETE